MSVRWSPSGAGVSGLLPASTPTGPPQGARGAQCAWGTQLASAEGQQGETQPAAGPDEVCSAGVLAELHGAGPVRSAGSVDCMDWSAWGDPSRLPFASCLACPSLLSSCWSSYVSGLGCWPHRIAVGAPRKVFSPVPGKVGRRRGRGAPCRRCEKAPTAAPGPLPWFSTLSLSPSSPSFTPALPHHPSASQLCEHPHCPSQACSRDWGGGTPHTVSSARPPWGCPRGLGEQVPLRSLSSAWHGGGWPSAPC